jgi:hypothetical protein
MKFPLCKSHNYVVLYIYFVTFLVHVHSYKKYIRENKHRILYDFKLNKNIIVKSFSFKEV